MPALDFAGGAVVHVNAGAAALAAALVLGTRSEYGRQAMLPHNVPFVLLGAGILWFGWMGFNGGSALAADEIAALGVVNTMLAPAGTVVVWSILDKIFAKQITAVGAATAIVVGLVAVTPAAGFVTPMAPGLHAHHRVQEGRRRAGFAAGVGARLFGRPPEASADTAVWLATDPGLGRLGGGYFQDRVELPCEHTDEGAEEALHALAHRMTEELS